MPSAQSSASWHQSMNWPSWFVCRQRVVHSNSFDHA